MNRVSVLSPMFAAKEHHGGEERAAEEPDTPLPGGPPLLLPDPGEALLRPGLRQRRRGRLPTLRVNPFNLQHEGVSHPPSQGFNSKM